LRRGRVVKDNTQALILLVGDRATPVTASSALYLAGTMLYMAEALGLGTCLVDSVLLAFRTRRRLRKKFRIETDTLAVLALGYSDERVLNIPRGYEVELRWNA
jgi:nitroreductase